MGAKSKWIEVESPDESVVDVAQRALLGRLELVWNCLGPAAREWDERIEHVHDLRVSTRRAMATLDIFESLLPERRREWFRRQLKRVRRAAGEARDLDVLGVRLLQACPDERLAGACGKLIDEVRARRQDAQSPIRKMHHKLAHKGFRRRIHKLVERVRPRGDAADRPPETYAGAASENLRPVIESFFAAAEADFSDIEALHEFRIEGKRLRYAMEVFAGAFEPSFRHELYPQIEKLQEKLGEINDRAAARARYQEWIDDCDDAEQCELMRDLMAQEDATLTELRQRFVQWWTHERAADLRDELEQTIDGKAAAC